MDLPQEIDDYLRESLEFSLGLPVSTRTLELKIRSSEETQRHIRDQCFFLKSKLAEKDKIIECIRAESSMNAQALKKFVKENQKLVIGCAELLKQRTKWDNECSLYERYIEGLMELGNQADARAKEAESRVGDLEDEARKLSEELQCFKQRSEGECVENFLVDALISTLINKDEIASMSHSFLEANNGVDVCQKMLKIWDGLKPSTHNLLALASEVKNLQKDKDILRINLIKAEQEVTVLFNENNILDEEHTRLTNLLDSEGSHSSGSIKNYKPKSSNRSVEKKIEISDATGSPTKLLSHCYITHNSCNLI
ncbi:hypothetical protein L1987_22642 [Smallanthus sonchifolius]|uniref:Uncharacterized protein n=1 Tax=Smallanthus sonchifolius TaxID=185202 RepID=A0ACB9IGB5_9ASTR|nr:hypothetical protein L1987_22642 [Smallanthus sonchifolius]